MTKKRKISTYLTFLEIKSTFSLVRRNTKKTINIMGKTPNPRILNKTKFTLFGKTNVWNIDPTASIK